MCAYTPPEGVRAVATAVVNRTVNLPATLYEWLQDEAKRRGVPVSQVIIAAIEAARQQAESKGR